MATYTHGAIRKVAVTLERNGELRSLVANVGALNLISLIIVQSSF